MSTMPFRTLVATDAHMILAHSGWHYGVPLPDQRFALWHEYLGDVILADAPEVGQDYLVALIDSPEIAAVMAILEPALI